MSLLDHHYDAAKGYFKLAGNAVEHGLADFGNDLGGLLREFRAALKTKAAKKTAAVPGLGQHGLAMAAGRPELSGFAPAAGGAGRQMPKKLKIAAQAGGLGFMGSGYSGATVDAVAGLMQASGSRDTSYRAVLAQARLQAEASRGRRNAERAALHMPPAPAGLAGMSFAPPPRGGAEGGVTLPSRGQSESFMPGFRRRTSVHDAVSAAEAALPEPAFAGEQEFAAGPVAAAAGAMPFDIEQALEAYLFRQSRLPPSSGAGFNPLLSPVWAGLKLPG